MSTTTIAQTARKYLATAFTTAVNDPSVLVYKSGDGVNLDAFHAQVAIYGATRTLARTQIVGSGGAGWLQEQIDIDVMIEVESGNDDPDVADDRAYSILTACEQAVRNDPTLGGIALAAWPSRTTSEHGWDDDRGRLTTIELTISISAMN